MENVQTVTEKSQKKKDLKSVRPTHFQLRPLTMSKPQESCSHIGFDSTWMEFFDGHFISSSENHPSSSATTHHPHDNSSSSQQHPQLVRGVSSDLYRTLDRRIEMERRIRTETMSTRVDSRGMFGEDFPPVDISTPRNCFRPGSRQPHFQKNEHSFVTTSYRYGNPKEYGAPLTSISGSNTSTNSTLQGSRVGITSREKQTRPLPQKNVRMRNGTSYSGGMERNRGYLYADAIPGATQAFQQRLIEIANLEGETIRYERTRKVKKKGKQDK